MRVGKAQAEADKILLDVDDLEASETPESVMLSTVSGEQNKDRTDREVVTPWLKFLWEAYRNVLDILRNNTRLESVYQVTNFLADLCSTLPIKPLISACATCVRLSFAVFVSCSVTTWQMQRSTRTRRIL